MLRRRQVFLNGVNIVICGNADHFHGASIAWASKVEKAHAMVSLPKHAAVTDCIGRSGIFSISVLSSGQSQVARQYGGRDQSDAREIDVDALDFTQWNVPVVKGACAQLLCSVKEMITLEEQELVISKILEVAADEDLEPLVYDHDHYFSS